MKRACLSLAAIAAVALPLAGCATSKPPKLAVCDGNPKHRRPANPYGSVLPGAPAVTAPATSSSGAPATSPAPPPPPPADKTSAVSVPSFYASC